MRSQEERNQNLEAFKSGDVRFLICTDVAARGIDIQELPFLIMTSLPDVSDQFFHRVGRVGRADRLGLAISIASAVKEKVWYHRCANRGRGCANTKLVDQGGCTVWFDEPMYLKEIQDKVGAPLPTMDPVTLEVPGILSGVAAGKASPKASKSQPKEQEDLRARKRPGAAAPTGPRREAVAVAGSLLVYGKARDDASTRDSIAHVQELRPAVDELRNLEQNIQSLFVTLPQRMAQA
eukprot:GHVT01095058.1.p1 GENE.GHVT01095058.1~~GHVT01095058.1.p1  ORF type:complete len:236 (-),score=58.65 GHVT01095058.1:983-1690(-)